MPKKGGQLYFLMVIVIWHAFGINRLYRMQLKATECNRLYRMQLNATCAYALVNHSPFYYIDIN